MIYGGVGPAMQGDALAAIMHLDIGSLLAHLLVTSPTNCQGTEYQLACQSM